MCSLWLELWISQEMSEIWIFHVKYPVLNVDNLFRNVFKNWLCRHHLGQEDTIHGPNYPNPSIVDLYVNHLNFLKKKKSPLPPGPAFLPHFPLDSHLTSPQELSTRQKRREMPCKGKYALHEQMKALLLWFLLTDIWVLGLDPGRCHPGSKSVAARMGDVCLPHLLSHLPDVPVVLPVWILQKIRVLASPGKNQREWPRPLGSSWCPSWVLWGQRAFWVGPWGRGDQRPGTRGLVRSGPQWNQDFSS